MQSSDDPNTPVLHFVPRKPHKPARMAARGECFEFTPSSPLMMPLPHNNDPRHELLAIFRYSKLVYVGNPKWQLNTFGALRVLEYFG